MRHNLIIILLLFCTQTVFSQDPPEKYQSIWHEINQSEPGSKSVLKELKSLREKNPSDPWIYWISGINCNPVTGQEQAAAFFRKAIEVDPTFPHAYYNLASTINDTNEEALREKIELYTKAVMYDPTLGFAFLGRGQAYLDLKEYDAAMSDCERSRKCPDMDIISVNMLQLHILWMQNKKQEALNLLRSVDLSEGFWGTDDQLLLASLYEEIGDKQRACTCYRNAAEPYEMMGEELPEKIRNGLIKCNE